jgi:hypothetical protein
MKKLMVFLAVVFLLLTTTVFAGTVNLPKTGQTKCYGNVWGIKIPCAGTGQDGEIQAGVAWPEPRFTDNDDDTMTDNLTGLMWTKNADLPEMTWQEALDYCNNLNLAGYSDWRLPNLNELESLFNAGEPDDLDWLRTQGFTMPNVLNSWYWSSTPASPEYGWAVMFWDGIVSEGGGCVWPVRAGQCGHDSVICLPKTGQTTSYATGDDGDLEMGVAWPDPRFADNGDGTITDNLTGLMWTKDANLPDGSKMWYQALNYVARMNAGIYKNFGYTDWRLPNRKELFSLIDRSQDHPALPAGHPFTNVQDRAYWSSSNYESGAWEVNMWSGDVGIDPKISIWGNYMRSVWPVRAGQVGH